MSKLLESINSQQVYVIAEMSANHAGKLENALEIVAEPKRPELIASRFKRTRLIR